MKNQTCCFTGHRKIPGNEIFPLADRLEYEIVRLIQVGVCDFMTGGAIGFDTITALIVLKLKILFPHIRLTLVLPCKNQTKWWDADDIKTYNRILSEADKVVYTSEHYHSGCMHKRNRYLVDNSDFCICYLTEFVGGTAYTVNYAKRKELRIINLAKY